MLQRPAGSAGFAASVGSLPRFLVSYRTLAVSAPNSARISIFRTQHVAGVVDALADNYVLSACRAIIPREIGASTFHDAAVARAAFGFAWPRNETLAYHAQPPRDPIFGPAHCDSYTAAKSASARAITRPATRPPANAPGRNGKVSRRR